MTSNTCDTPPRALGLHAPRGSALLGLAMLAVVGCGTPNRLRGGEGGEDAARPEVGTAEAGASSPDAVALERPDDRSTAVISYVAAVADFCAQKARLLCAQFERCGLAYAPDDGCRF